MNIDTMFEIEAVIQRKLKKKESFEYGSKQLVYMTGILPKQVIVSCGSDQEKIIPRILTDNYGEIICQIKYFKTWEQCTLFTI